MPPRILSFIYSTIFYSFSQQVVIVTSVFEKDGKGFPGKVVYVCLQVFGFYRVSPCPQKTWSNTCIDCK